MHFPGVRRRELENGVRVWTVEHREVPLISFLVLLPAGASADPDDRPGLAAITGDLLDEGCGDLNALELHEALGRIGAQIDTEVGSDATLLGLTALERFADRGAGASGRHRHAPDAGTAGLRSDSGAAPEQARAASRHAARDRRSRVHPAASSRDIPTGHLPIGTEESLREMQLDEVVTFHRRAYRAQRATVIAVGDATHDRLALDGRSRPSAAGVPHCRSESPFVDPATVSAPDTPDVRVALVHRAGAAQSELRIGHVGLPRSTPDYHALLVLNMILGGQFVSRINMNLREDKGYTYGARTSFDFRRGPGLSSFRRACSRR